MSGFEQYVAYYTPVAYPFEQYSHLWFSGKPYLLDIYFQENDDE